MLRVLEAVWKVWGITRQLLSVRGLLDWIGWKEWVGAGMTALLFSAWGYTAGLPKPVLAFLALAGAAVVVFIWRVLTFDYQPKGASARVHRRSAAASGAPILECKGKSALTLDWFGGTAQVIAIQNTQESTTPTAFNVKGSIEFYHANGIDRFLVSPAGWLLDKPRPCTPATVVDLKSGETQFISLVVWSADGLPHVAKITDTSFDVGRPLANGQWNVRLLVSADNCPEMEHTFSFTLSEGGLMRFDKPTRRETGMVRGSSRRTLDDEQRAVILPVLRKYKGSQVLIEHAMGTVDGEDYARAFVAIFREAGWDLGGVRGYSSVMWASMPVGCELHADKDSNIARDVANILASAGVDTDNINVPGATGIRLRIGVSA